MLSGNTLLHVNLSVKCVKGRAAVTHMANRKFVTHLFSYLSEDLPLSS